MRLSLIVLGVICTASLVVKIYQTDFLEPLFFDANLYNNFAWNFSHQLGSLPPLHNIGFPLFLSPIFAITPDFMTSSIIQKAISVIFSTVTIPIFYKLSRRFLPVKYSLVASAMVAFEPHLILNSTFGITEPQYLFLFVSALFFGTSKKYAPIGFLLAGLATITRFEGIVLLALLPAIYIYQNKISMRNILKTGLFVLIFITPVALVTYYNLQVGTHENVFDAKIAHEELVANNVLSRTNATVHIILNSLLYLGWSTYPVFIGLVPISLYMIFRKSKKAGVITISIITLLAFPGVFAYFRAYDTRYFMQLYPVLAIMCSYGIQRIIQSKRLRLEAHRIISITENHEHLFYGIILVCAVTAALYLMVIPETPIVFAETNRTLVIFPTYTLAAYDRNGFYDYYKNKCDISCLTIRDRFNDISKIEYHAYGIDMFRKSGYDMVSDRALDDNPSILKQYQRIIVLHNEYVTQKEFTALTDSKHVIYLYPNALYAMVQRNPDNTITLLRGHNYPAHDITNGFNWQYDNSNIEYDRACKNIHFYKIPNGTMLNCYPEDIINSSTVLWEALSKI